MMFLRPIKFLSFILALSLFLASASFAMAQTESKPPSYQALLLTDETKTLDLSWKSYAIKESEDPISLETIERMVRDGNIIPHIRKTPFLSLGATGKGIWVVLPVVNNSTKNLWTLDIGSFGEGRYSNFKEVILYDMNNKNYLVNTVMHDTMSHSIPSSIQLNIPIKKTIFFLLYMKSNIGIPSHINPVLFPANQMDNLHLISSWICILLTFSTGLYFIKLALNNRDDAQFYFSLVWVTISVYLFLRNGVIYAGSLDTEIISPLTWILSSLFLMVSLFSIEEGRHKLPLVFLGGMASIFLICGLAGLVILKSLPSTSFYLIYIPIFMAFTLTASTCWLFIIRERRMDYLPLALTGTIMAIIFSWVTALSFGIVPATSLTVTIPQALLIASVFGCIASSMATASKKKTVGIEKDHDVFQENQLFKKEISQIHEAKEKSEHRRLMQVIEQERKLMSELQVQTAQQNDEMRRSKEAADEANRAKSAFLAIVSHEIRTPMTGIMGMLRLLQDTQLSREQKEYATTIKDSGDAMLALLNDILDFEKIESGKMDLENISFDLKRLIRGVYTLMRGHAEAKNIDIILEMDPNTPTWVTGDPTRLRQVLLNLINNAIKFTNKGNVFLRVRDLTGESSETFQKTHQIYFAVQDSGIGISAEAQKKLFMPFAQADSTINRKYGGTGLGLAICKRLIAAMGGAISINSKESEGSTFFFTLSMPTGSVVEESQNQSANDGVEVFPSQPTPQINFTSPVLVLVVDDNGINQRVASGFIEKLGAQAMTANCGADALDMLSRYPFDLILMDLQLPDMNGIEVTEFIRKLSIPGKANVPIVALTGNTDSEDMKACYDAGMNDFATKPITFEKIAELLMKIQDQTYFNQKVPQTLGFDTPETIEDVSFVNRIKENSISLSDTDTSFLDDADFDIDEDEDDSFALAVKKFEEQETTAANSPLPSLKGTFVEVGLDETILKSLRSGLSVAQIQEILVSFYEKADELIADIGNTYLEGDSVSLYARAHELKGMAGNFGFSGISMMCTTIEKAAKDNALETAKDAIDHLGESYAVARGRLNEWLNEA